MWGAIAGDIIGSAYEGVPIKTTEFPLFHPNGRFTDDTVLTVATADALLRGRGYADRYRHFYRLYPRAGYGGNLNRWAEEDDLGPYQSWGNGSAMRVSAIGWAFETLEETLAEAERSAAVTHNHPEGVKGAQATAAAVFLARRGTSKQAIKEYVERVFHYDLSRRLDDIRPAYRFDVSCQGSVPESIIAFVESADYESAVRNAVSLGGDTDTMGCIAGSIAEAFYGGVPSTIREKATELLSDHLFGIVEEFEKRYLVPLA